MSEDRLTQLEGRVAELERVIAGLRAVFGGGEEVADDYELDGKYGDPQIKKDPTERFWRGASYVNRRLSDCPPEYLDAYAKYRDLLASLKEKEGGEAKLKYARFDRSDAARARGWAKRLRSGWKPSEPRTPAFTGAANGTGGSLFRGNGFGSPSPSSLWGTPPGAAAGVAGTAQTAEPAPAPSVDRTDESEEDTEFRFGANVAPEPAPVADDEPEELT